MRLFDGKTNVAAQTFGGNHSGSKLSSVQANVYPWVEGVQESNHTHVQIVIGHGNVGVFRLYKINANEAGISGGHLEAQQCLGENDFPGSGAQNLIQITDLNLAGGNGIDSATV